MDELDYKILEELRKNSREKNIEIARKFDVSEGTIRKRIKNLYNDGIIKKFTIETLSSVDSIILIKVDPKKAEKVLKKMREIYNDLYEFSGSIDIAIRLTKNNLDELNSEVDNIRNMDGVINTDTMIRLK